MITKSLIAWILIGYMQIGSTSHSDGQNRKDDETLVSGYFDGTEPFWDMEIRDNRVLLHCVNAIVTDTLTLSRKQTHTETYAFQGNEIHGIVKLSDKGGCTLDITEEESPTHEIYFSYRNVTYMGCGKLTIQGR